jgi:hypothetical protein
VSARALAMPNWHADMLVLRKLSGQTRIASLDYIIRVHFVHSDVVPALIDHVHSNAIYIEENCAA